MPKSHPTGSESSQDEHGSVAYKKVEWVDYLVGVAVGRARKPSCLDPRFLTSSTPSGLRSTAPDIFFGNHADGR